MMVEPFLFLILTQDIIPSDMNIMFGVINKIISNSKTIKNS